MALLRHLSGRVGISHIMNETYGGYKVISAKRPNGLLVLTFFISLFSIFYGFGAQRASAFITYEFDEGIEMLSEGLLSNKSGLLEKKKIAVFGIIESISKKKWGISSHIEDGIVDVLVNKGYTVIERRRIDDVIKEEIKKRADWWFDETQVAQFGKLMGADVVVTGTYVIWGPASLKIPIRAINVTDGTVLAANKVQVLTDRITALLKPEDVTSEEVGKPQENKKDYSGDRFQKKNPSAGEMSRPETDKENVASNDKSESLTADVIERDGIYIAYANGIVQDTNTGLEWKVGPDKDTNWKEARSWVQSLNLDGGGWRMPTMDELKGLYKEGMGSHNITPFLKTTSKYLWVWSGETNGSSGDRDSGAKDFTFRSGYRVLSLRLTYNDGRAFAVGSRNAKSTAMGKVLKIGIHKRTQEPKDNAYALLVGIRKYQELNISEFSDHDARQVFELLTRMGGFRNDHIRLLVDSDATIGSLYKELNWLVRKAKLNPEAKIIFYFSGHGFSAQGDNGNHCCPVYFSVKSNSYNRTCPSTCSSA